MVSVSVDGRRECRWPALLECNDPKIYLKTYAKEAG